MTSGEISGVSVSLNSDGTVVAIGAFTFSGGAGGNSGTTYIYEWSGTAWVLKGSQINGLTSGENSGISVSMNSTGTIVAIGAYNFSGGAAGTSGTTRIYEWSGTAWVLKGSQIDGLTSGERSGYSVSISSDGTLVAIGAYKNNLDTGTTRIYEWNGTAWTFKRQINGLTTGESSGFSVSINGDGNVVGIGAFNNNSNTGTTRIYNVNPPGHLYVGGDSSLNGQLYVAGTMEVNEDASLNSNLYVGGDVSFNKNLYVKENLIVDGNVSLKQYNNEYIVNTHTTNYDLIVAEDLSVNGNLFINNDTSLNGDLYVAGSIAGTLSTPAQSNITSVGTLSSLTLSGHITPSTHGTINMGTDSLKFNEIHGVNIQSNTIIVNNDISFTPNVGVVHQF